MTGPNLHGKSVQLDRRLTPLNVWALALGCIIGWGSFILPGTTFLPAAGPLGTALAMGIAAVVMIIIAANYSYLIKRFPQAGGEFAYVQTSLGKGHAFVCAWLLGLCYLALVAQNATALALVGRQVLGGVFQVGPHYSLAGFDIYAPELLIAWAALVLFAMLSIRGVHFTGIFQTILVFAIVGGLGVLVFVAFAQQGAGFINPQPAFNPHFAPHAGVLAVLAIAPFAFVGFDTIPQAAEEYHFPPAKARVLIAVAIVFGALIYSALAFLATAAQPAGYSDWTSYIEASSSLEGVAALPTFYAAQQLMGPVGLGLLVCAALAAILSGIVGFYMATSRLLFALAREGILPAWFASLHPRYHTPHHAILFILGVCVIAPLFGRTVLGWLVDMSALGAAVAYAYTSFVACRHARLRGDPSIVVTGILGTVFALVFVALLLVPFPGLNASLGLESFVCLAVWVLLGLAFYITSTPGAATALFKLFLPTSLRGKLDEQRRMARYHYFCSLDESDYPQALAEWYWRATRKRLDLDNPCSFDEKIQWLKLYDATPEKGRLSDKYLVREWVADRVGEEYLMPLLGVWDTPEDIDFERLPNRFVLKATHGCGWNIFVNDKNKLDVNLAKDQLQTWLSTDYAFMSGLELQYQHCEPRIIAEQYLESDGGDLFDYKFFCFDAQVACIGVVRGRATQPEEACYDRMWNRMPCTYYGHPRLEGDFPKPVALDEAIRVAETLAAGFPHVRVDLYMPKDGTVRFGEMTFTTASGNSKWDPPEYNDYFGSLIDLTQLPRWKEMHGTVG